MSLLFSRLFIVGEKGLLALPMIFFLSQKKLLRKKKAESEPFFFH
jgi:hypothetical protein